MRLTVLGLTLLILCACQAADVRFPQHSSADAASIPLTKASEILVVYIGASDCPPCLTFKTRDYPRWIETEAYAQVTYREVHFPSFRRTDEDRYWPADLRWLREATYARRGTPRWIIAVDGRVVSNVRNWKGRAYPLIQRVAARKRDA